MATRRSIDDVLARDTIFIPGRSMDDVLALDTFAVWRWFVDLDGLR